MRVLYEISLAVAAAGFVVVAAVMGWTIVRGRDRDAKRVPADLLWWALPTALMLVLFVMAAQLLGAGGEP
jgi:heme/copper-type cytochrome/quinol oxidase subunit 2